LKIRDAQPGPGATRTFRTPNRLNAARPPDRSQRSNSKAVPEPVERTVSTPARQDSGHARDASAAGTTRPQNSPTAPIARRRRARSLTTASRSAPIVRAVPPRARRPRTLAIRSIEPREFCGQTIVASYHRPRRAIFPLA